MYINLFINYSNLHHHNYYPVNDIVPQLNYPTLTYLVYVVMHHMVIAYLVSIMNYINFQLHLNFITMHYYLLNKNLMETLLTIHSIMANPVML